MLLVEAVQQLISEQRQTVLLLQAGLFLLMREGRLANQQNCQQDDAPCEQDNDDIQDNRLPCYAFVSEFLQFPKLLEIDRF